MSIDKAQRSVFGTIIIILILTALEFPAPIGFETRPQTGVSIYWLIFFLVILITEIGAILTIYKKPKVGGRLGIMAAIFNILQISADQLHLMQPEVASFGYLILEDIVAVCSVILAYYSWVAIVSDKTDISH